MDSSIKVSIICDVYNHEKYIRDTLDGFVEQKVNFAYEILIHDDASTDKSADIIREYERKYPNIVKPIYQTENQYSKHDGTIRRIQAERAKGKYVALCEGDDYWTDTLKLQKQYDFMEKNPEYSMCTCSVKWFNMRTNKQESKVHVDKDRDISLQEIILESKGRIFQTASVFIKKDVWETRPMWGFPIGDYPLAIHAALNGKVRMLADCMCVYRYYSEGSWTARMDDEERRIVVAHKMINALYRVNEDTNGVYADIINQRILKYKYTIALMEKDLKSICSGELKQIYKSRNIVYRMSDIFRCKMPTLYTKIRNLLKV